MPALKAARRRLVKSLHPDRFPIESESKRNAEQRVKEINTAFDRLVTYYRQFGFLPDVRSDDIPAASPSPDVVPTTSQPDPARRYAKSSRYFQRKFSAIFASWRTALVLVLLAILLSGIVRSILTSNDGTEYGADPSLGANQPAPDPIQAQPSSIQRSDDYFTVGSSLGTVYAIQGVPTATEDGAWHYGKSTVYFSEGVVTAWKNDAADPLNATLDPLPSHTTEQQRTSFTIGSTKAEVRAIQGTPLVETDTLWDFGLAKVHFRDDRVIGWENSPMYPLKARK